MSTRHLSFALAAVFCLTLNGACSPDSAPGTPEAAAHGEPLDTTIHDIVAAIGDKEAGRVLDHVSREFLSEDGLDFVDVRAIVEAFLLREGRLGARLESLTIEDAGVAEGEKRAHAWLSFAPGARLRADTPLPANAVSYSFELIFAHREGRWQAMRGAYARQ